MALPAAGVLLYRLIYCKYSISRRKLQSIVGKSYNKFKKTARTGVRTERFLEDGHWCGGRRMRVRMELPADRCLERYTYCLFWKSRANPPAACVACLFYAHRRGRESMHCGKNKKIRDIVSTSRILARPIGFEPTTYRFVAGHSIR